VPVLLVVVVAIAAAATYRYIERPRIPDLPNPPLKTLAQADGLQLGNFAIYNHLGDPAYRAILTGQFDLAIIDNTPNWAFTDGGLRPGPHSYNFKQMDQIVDFAQANHMAIQAHHFVWGEQKWLPDWLKNGHYSKAQLLQIMKDHILTVGGRYRGKISEWTVVNEAFTRAQHLYGLSDWWADHLGGDGYIDDAFTWAHQADPQAQLILNDFGNEAPNSISNAMYTYAKGALSRGVPINGIGMQMHIDGTNPPSESAVVANMRRFGKLGLDVYVTEFDVNMQNVAGSTADKEQKEAQIYYDMLRACIDSKVCHSFSILGITDAETWYNYLGSTQSMPLPFDKKYQPKPAYYAIREALTAGR
jgi:endo-1,4-beta-xylanase